MIEDEVLNSVLNVTALMAEVLGEPRSVLPIRPSWFRLRTEVRHVKRCIDHVPFGTQAYLVRGDGRLVLIEKVRWQFPYEVTVAGEARPVRGDTVVYFTNQPGVAGLTIEECLG